MMNTKDLKKSLFPLKVLLYGQSGVGKTLLASTFPKPKVLDLEDGVLTLRGLDVEYKTILLDFEHPRDAWKQLATEVNSLIKSCSTAEETIILDSLTAANEMAFEFALGGATVADFATWGKTLDLTTELVKTLRRANCNVVITCQENVSKDDILQTHIYRPSMFGKATEKVPFLLDEVYRLSVDSTGKHIIQTAAEFRSHAKSRLNRTNILQKKVEWKWDESNPHSNPIFDAVKAADLKEQENATKK
jgi:hypothetical protein